MRRGCLSWAAIALASLVLLACGKGEATKTISPPLVTPSLESEARALGKVAYDGGYSKELPDGQPTSLPFASHPQWSASGTWLLFEVATSEQWVMRGDGCVNGISGTECPQARQLNEHGYAAWSPKDDQLAYMIGGHDMTALAAENADGSGRREWQLPMGGPEGVSWSPDGKWIAVAEEVDDGGRRSELWIVPSDRGNRPVERPIPTLEPPPTSVPLEERTGRATIEVSASVPTENPIIGPILATDASVHVLGDGIDLTVTTAENGRAIIKDVPVSTDPERPTRVNVIITAPGYAPFSFKWVPLYPGNGPILTPDLSDQPQVDDLSDPVPPMRPAPTPLPLLTPPAPPLGGIALYGSVDEAIQLDGWTGDSRYVLFQMMPNDRQTGVDDKPLSLRSVSIADGELGELPPVMSEKDLWQALPDTSLIIMTASTSRDMWAGQRIALVDAATGEVTYLTDEDTASQQPSWSPDGRQIAYVSQPDRGDATGETDEEFAQLVAGRHIWLMKSDGSGRRQLTDDPQYRDERPLWSKDGSMILFTRVSTGGSVSLWLVAASGEEPQQVAAIDSSSEGGLWHYPGGAGWGSLCDWWRGP
jgi:Tol biopolymer transport system component